jgi:hypothetical protein
MKLVLALMLALTLRAQAVLGAERAPLIVIVHEDAERLVPPAALGEKLANDLDIPVVHAARTPAARGVLTISWDEARRRLILTYRDASGEERSRIFADGLDQRASLEMIALIAANLVRNDADELLALVKHQHSSAEPPRRDDSAQPAEPLRLAADSSSATSNVVVSRRRVNRALAQRWSFGILGYISSRSAEPVYSPGSGFYVSRTMSKHFALGFTDIMVFPDEGQTVLSGGPYAETFWFARDWLQLFGQLGIPLQGRWSANRPAAFGAQPFVGGGLRFWIGGRVSIGAAARVAVVASSAFDVPPTGLVQGTVSVSGGLELGFHL